MWVRVWGCGLWGCGLRGFDVWDCGVWGYAMWGCGVWACRLPGPSVWDCDVWGCRLLGHVVWVWWLVLWRLVGWLVGCTTRLWLPAPPPPRGSPPDGPMPRQWVWVALSTVVVPLLLLPAHPLPTLFPLSSPSPCRLHLLSAPTDPVAHTISRQFLSLLVSPSHHHGT